jgi:hypothetical protein|tara:strand:+ start:2639 stop:2806 length:168 start_codon:yes stop_codon:yes gene_type:complete
MVQRITKQSPVGGARLRKPNGEIITELPDTPFDPNAEGETRTINPETGFFGTKVS